MMNFNRRNFIAAAAAASFAPPVQGLRAATIAPMPLTTGIITAAQIADATIRAPMLGWLNVSAGESVLVTCRGAEVLSATVLKR